MNTMPSNREDLISYISDAYKDLNGLRPRYMDFDSMSEEELEQMARELSDAISEEVKMDRVREQNRIDSFERSISTMMELGAPDRESAIRWIMDANDVYDRADTEFVCYQLGLPYSMSSMFEGV